MNSNVTSLVFGAIVLFKNKVSSVFGATVKALLDSDVNGVTAFKNHNPNAVFGVTVFIKKLKLGLNSSAEKEMVTLMPLSLQS